MCIFFGIGDEFVVICFVPYMDFVDELMVYPMSSTAFFFIYLFHFILLFCNCHFLPKNCVAIDAFFVSSAASKGDLNRNTNTRNRSCIQQTEGKKNA